MIELKLDAFCIKENPKTRTYCYIAPFGKEYYSTIKRKDIKQIEGRTFIATDRVGRSIPPIMKEYR